MNTTAFVFLIFSILIFFFFFKLKILLTKVFGQDIYLKKYLEDIKRGNKGLYTHQLIFKNKSFETKKNPKGMIYCRNLSKVNYDNTPYFSYQEFHLKYRKIILGNYHLIIEK